MGRKAKLRERIGALENQIKLLRQEVDSGSDAHGNGERSDGLSRRGFLKKAAVGAAGLGAAAMIPSGAGLQVRSPYSFKYYGNGDQDFEISADGTLTTDQIGKISDKINDIYGKNITAGNSFTDPGGVTHTGAIGGSTHYVQATEPSNPQDGDVWIDTS